MAAGCSWVAAKSIDRAPKSADIDWGHVEDLNFVKSHSFAGILQKKLGLDEIHFLAESGSNNTAQLHKIVEFVKQNKNNYSKIFVLWGITSIYRWQMYSSSTEDIEDCVYTSIPFKKNVDFRQEIDYYFKHFWNKDYELAKLGNNIELLNGFLLSHNIDHIFVNSFQTYTKEDLQITANCLIEKDMLKMLCDEYSISSPVGFLNVMLPHNKQQTEITQLHNLGLLDVATNHPTVKAHSLIADYIFKHINE